MTDRRPGFFDRLRSIFGRKAPPTSPPPAPRGSRSSISRQEPSPFAKPEPQVRYMKERTSMKFKADPAARRKRWLIMGAVVGVLLLAATTAVVLFVYRTTIPEDLVGTYRTDDPRYSSRRFELLEDQVVFQIGDSASAVERYPVVHVRRGRSSRGRLYRVRYSGEENATFEFAFTWRQQSNEIRLENQPEFAWRRAGPPSPRPQLGLQ